MSRPLFFAMGVRWTRIPLSRIVIPSARQAAFAGEDKPRDLLFLRTRKGASLLVPQSAWVIAALAAGVGSARMRMTSDPRALKRVHFDGWRHD